jgi:tetratricopeptide (TPR) repeat protein
MPLLERQRRDVLHLRANESDGTGRTPELDGVDDDERVGGLEQLLHEMDPADADVQDAYLGRDPALQETLGDDDSEPVVAAEEIADARDQHSHVVEDTGALTVPDEAIRELRGRLERYPPDRYPVQHATAQFHLGLALTNAGCPVQAEAALAIAIRLFAPERLPVEHARTLNALGASLRMAGRGREAAEVLARAAAIFEEQGRALEQGAALFNLGLVRRESGDPALDAFRWARKLIDPGQAPAQAAAAAREHGTSLLAAGEVEEAIRALEEACRLADRAGSQAELGAAANGLGLAQLAAARAEEAIGAFGRAAACHPRSVRPQEYAMVKANLALAHEQAGDGPRARLAARQALAVRDAADAVTNQAAAVLSRLGAASDDLFSVLGVEPQERRLAIVREELARWADLPPAAQEHEAAAWIAAQLEHPAATDLAETWLGGLLELPPEAMERIVRATMKALGETAPDHLERFRSHVAAASARFHTPQLMRVTEMFARLAAEQRLPW